MHLVSSPFLPSLVQPAKEKSIWHVTSFLTHVVVMHPQLAGEGLPGVQGTECKAERHGATWGATTLSQRLVHRQRFYPQFAGHDEALCHQQHCRPCCVCSWVSLQGWSLVTELHRQESVRVLTVWTSRAMQPCGLPGPAAQLRPKGLPASANTPCRISAGGSQPIQGKTSEADPHPVVRLEQQFMEGSSDLEHMNCSSGCLDVRFICTFFQFY